MHLQRSQLGILDSSLLNMPRLRDPPVLSHGGMCRGNRAPIRHPDTIMMIGIILRQRLIICWEEGRVSLDRAGEKVCLYKCHTVSSLIITIMHISYGLQAIQEITNIRKIILLARIL